MTDLLSDLLELVGIRAPTTAVVSPAIPSGGEDAFIAQLATQLGATTTSVLRRALPDEPFTEPADPQITAAIRHLFAPSLRLSPSGTAASRPGCGSGSASRPTPSSTLRS